LTGDLGGVERTLGTGLEFVVREGSMPARISSERIEAPEIKFLARELDMRELVDSSERHQEPVS